MTAQNFREIRGTKQLEEYRMHCAIRENHAAIAEIHAYEKYLDNPVKIVKGRKIPIGTTGTCFWIGMRNYSKYGNWWSWEVRIGFKDKNGNAFFTPERNIELCI